MREVRLRDVEGVRWLPDEVSGVGALVLAGSSGRVDSARAELLARSGAVAESIQWFGGVGQHEGPWEIPVELFLDRAAALAKDCERVLVLGTSFGAEAALLTGAHSPDVDAVVAFAPSDVVWAGVRADGTVTSHWAMDGAPLPHVPFDESWEPDDDVPAFLGMYEASRRRFSAQIEAATIPVERIKQLVLVAGGDDQVWPSVEMAESIRARREKHRLDTLLLSAPDAGHRTILPGEPTVTGGMRIRRGGTEAADRDLGTAAWPHVERLLHI
ncbi:pimeloyl-ACP methyl ester carboxylesterase [Nocardioides daedukensis]|uniref:Pimeloyl-ACP methyl ester carboxylesterase n=1 Tax=Nocardioides daedukensis TaxID=634462 RepID=A0A7Y9UTW2_9ACTN|nr:acyl-CoA thioester hydrolase/BAAT C-terminal domain-containing protein [Nocardioides daedukensis]NYG59324.1 pimeloyl-ACP methyl ester carboxylesterase [Nocardioides daedukensis]